MIISKNGTLIEQSEAVVSAYDHGFLYGIGLFETFRTYGGRPFLLDRHMTRLADGCEQLAIRHAPQEAEVRRQIADLLAANELQDAYFRLTVTAGADILGLSAGPYEQPTVILYAKPLAPPDRTLDELGKPLLLLRTRRNTPEGPYRLKSLHYMNNVLARMELHNLTVTLAAASGAHSPEGLMLTAGGQVAEGIVSNVFFVKDGCVRTPSVDTGILPGITRGYVMELAAACELAVEEGLYSWEQLLAADEVFLTSSIQELVPVTALIDEHGSFSKIPTGPVTRRLLTIYRKEANGYEPQN